jgi:putative flippase GtrA
MHPPEYFSQDNQTGIPWIKLDISWLDNALASLIPAISDWFHALRLSLPALSSEQIGYGLFLSGVLLILLATLTVKIKKNLKPGTIGQFIKFATIGALGTIFHYILLIVMVSIFYQPPVLATSCGALLGAIINYVLNKTLTFRSSRKHSEALPRFLLLATIGLALNGLIMACLLDLGMFYLMAQIIATGFILIFNYFVSRVWIFH